MDNTSNPVIFMHGDMQNHTVFQRMEKLMQEYGHQTLSFDLPGHGLSAFSEKEKDLPHLLEQIITEHNLEKPILIGHSSGGTLAVDYATRREVSGLVLLNAPLFSPVYSNPDIKLEEWEALHEQFKGLSKSEFKKQELVDYMDLKNPTDDSIREIGLRTTNPLGFENNIAFYKDLPENEDFFELKCPILYMVSNNDIIAPPKYADINIKKMNKGKLIVIEKGGHNPHITKPEIVVSALRKNYSFLTGQKA